MLKTRNINNNRELVRLDEARCSFLKEVAKVKIVGFLLRIGVERRSKVSGFSSSHYIPHDR